MYMVTPFRARVLLLAASFALFSPLSLARTLPSVEIEPRSSGATARLPTGLTEDDVAVWQTIASGHHSLREIPHGTEFYVDIPMRPVAGARLAYFNAALAERLGLKIPSDPKELESFLIGLFALEIDPTGKSPLRMMATRYQDSNDKGPGYAMGDGRAVWTGELKITLPNGSVLSVDFTAKGVGATPLAWTKNDASHSDGRQKTKEFVRSAIISDANVANELDSTDDLIAFVIYEDGKPSRSITVRAGNQTRMAHLRYWHDTPDRFREIFDYVLRRDLGLKPDAKVGRDELATYLDRLTVNLATETARYADLEAIHGSPTNGNRTTRGSTIDLMEFWYHDAYHSNFKYLFDRVQLDQQPTKMWTYVSNEMVYLRDAKYAKYAKFTNKDFANRLALFNTTYYRALTSLWLRRLGLSEPEIARLSPAARAEFYNAANALRSATATESRRIFWNDIPPAVFEMRSVFAETFARWKDPDRLDSIFVHSRPWATDQTAFEPLKTSYLKSIERIKSSIAPTPEEMGVFAYRARRAARSVRPDPGVGMPATPGDPFFHAHDEKILAVVEDESKLDYRVVGRMIHAAALELTDPDLLPRGDTNLGPSPGSRRYRPVSARAFCPWLVSPVDSIPRVSP